MATDRARVRLIVRGRVQGVMFRLSAADEAQVLGVTGYARNCADGAVEIVAEGRRRDLEVFVAWAQAGPPSARVTDVEEEWQEFKGEFRSFMVR